MVIWSLSSFIWFLFLMDFKKGVWLFFCVCYVMRLLWFRWFFFFLENGVPIWLVFPFKFEKNNLMRKNHNQLMSWKKQVAVLYYIIYNKTYNLQAQSKRCFYGFSRATARVKQLKGKIDSRSVYYITHKHL